MATAPTTIDPDSGTLHNLYRPKTLARCIGHEKVVQRLQGVINSKKYPGAMLFVGPTSAGKTTLARAFVTDMMGEGTNLKGNPDYMEINAAEQRGIDDVRQLLSVAKLKPRFAPRRVIVIDEAQQLTGPSAQAMLKPLENPPPSTLFIICTMEPEKLPPAIKNRCQVFMLNAPSVEDMTKYVKRVAKGEGMSEYITGKPLAKIVQNSNGEMRIAAGIVQALQQWIDGLQEKPKSISENDVDEALGTVEGQDDILAVKIMMAVYCRKFKVIQKCLLDIQDPFRLINKLLQLNSFLLNNYVLDGAKHKAVWFSSYNVDLNKGWPSTGITEARKLQVLGMCQSALVKLKLSAASFLVPDITLPSSVLFELVTELKKVVKVEKE